MSEAAIVESTKPEPYLLPGEMIKAAEVDSVLAADQFLHQPRFVKDDTSTLKFWRGSFYIWNGGAYQTMSLEEVEILVDCYLQNFVYLLNSGTVGNVVGRLKAKSAISNQRDAPIWLGQGLFPWPVNESIVAKNGIFHLPTLAKRLEAKDEADDKPFRVELTPQLFTHTALDFAIDTDAPDPAEFLRFLDELWPNDPESIACLQEWFGYLLTADTSQQKVLLLVGPKRAGKGVLTRVLKDLVGCDNVASPTFASLGGNFGLQGLVGKSVTIIHDARLGSNRSDIVTERLLSISGEDALDIDRKYLEPLSSVRLGTRIVVVSNEVPRLQDASGALASRFSILRLTNSFYGQEDHGLTERLLKELPGIFLWAVRRWSRLRRQKYFTRPSASEALVREMEELASPVKTFVEECL